MEVCNLFDTDPCCQIIFSHAAGNIFKFDFDDRCQRIRGEGGQSGDHQFAVFSRDGVLFHCTVTVQDFRMPDSVRHTVKMQFNGFCAFFLVLQKAQSLIDRSFKFSCKNKTLAQNIQTFSKTTFIVFYLFSWLVDL